MDSAGSFREGGVNRRRTSTSIQYSIQDYGCMCYQSALNNLKFLVRISLRVDNIVSIELVSSRQVNENE